MTIDLNRFDGYNSGNILTKPFHQLRNLPRNLFGVPTRLVIWGLLAMGLLDGMINKSIKFMFGNSYNAEKVREEKEALKEQKKFLKEDLNKRLYEAQLAKENGSNSENTNAIVQQDKAASNAQNVNSEVNKEEADTYSYVPSQENIFANNKPASKADNYSYIPSQDSTLRGNDVANSNIRSYIPSQAAANIVKNYDNSGLQSALSRADRAENKALKVLAGNFEGM